MNSERDMFYRKIDEAVFGQPETCDEILHKYGTYNIQPTSDSDNSYPKISQGLPKSRMKKNYKGFDKKERAD